tara:strand:- start:540 stop:1364 length:825 start_codon:yes stop_codon:yes gene_type:complete
MNKDETDLLKTLVESVSKQSGGGVGDEFHEDIKNFKNRVWVEVAQLQERLSTIEKLEDPLPKLDSVERRLNTLLSNTMNGESKDTVTKLSKIYGIFGGINKHLKKLDHNTEINNESNEQIKDNQEMLLAEINMIKKWIKADNYAEKTKIANDMSDNVIEKKQYKSQFLSEVLKKRKETKARESITKTVEESFGRAEWKDIQVTDLDINTRTIHLFVKLGINTLEDLSKYTRKQLVSFPDYGWDSMMKLDKALEKTGLTLKEGIKTKRVPEEFKL